MPKFWDIYQEELLRSIHSNPTDYMVTPNETAEAYAKRIREKFEPLGIMRVNWNSPSFRRVAKRLGIKFTRAALHAAAIQNQAVPG